MKTKVCTRRCSVFFVFTIIVLGYLRLYWGLHLPGYIFQNRIDLTEVRLMKTELNQLNKCFRLSWNVLQESGSISGQSVSLNIINNAAIDERQTKRININASQFLNDEATAKKETCKRFLTKSTIIGRLGNQLFQYSSLLGMACEFDYVPVITRSSSILQKYFDIPNVADVSLKNLTPLKCIGGKHAKHYNCSSYLQNQTKGIFDIPVNIYLQSWKYFSKCRSVVKQVLKLKQKHILSARKFLSTNAKGWKTRVCIHVRRGDMLETRNRDLGYRVVNESYINRARQYFEKKYVSVVFIVLSDDMKWCKETLKGNILFSPFNDPGDDMALMTFCDHVIITSGSFGWWGAWLSGGTTIYFKNFIQKNSPLSIEMVLQDYYPPHWIPM